MNLKVAILVDSLTAGGVQNTAIEEAYYLNKLGYGTKIISLSKRNFNKVVIIKKVEYEFLENRYPKFLKVNFKFPFFHFFSFIHLISPLIAPFKIKGGEFDLIIAHNTISGLTALMINKFHHIPYYLTVHDPAIFIMDKIYKKTFLGFLFPIFLPLIKFVEKKVFINAKIIFTDSNVYQNFLHRIYQVNSQTLYLGITPQKKPVNLGRDFISLSRWDLAKNPNLILDIAEHFKNRRFIIAGKWTNEKELNKFALQIKYRKLTKQIILKTNLKSKKGLFENKLAFVHPHFEAFGLGALEAASYGLPVIIPDKSGVTEILQNETDRIFPQKATKDQLIKSIEILINNPEIAKRISEELFSKARNYTWEQHTKVLDVFLQKSLDQKINTAILETGHINLQFLAGGDIILQKLIKSLLGKLKVTVITTEFGALHWRKNMSKIEIRILNQSKDKTRSPFGVFLTYVKRSLKSFTLLRKTKPQLIVSTTDIFPDVLPAFFYKLTSRKTNWITWIHHLIPPPNKRKGKLVTNLASYISQLVSLIAIRISADIIICRNRQIIKNLQKFGFPTNKLRLINTGVDFFKIYDSKIRTNYNLDGIFVGRLQPLKGIFDLPQIWDYVIKEIPKAKLAIVGADFKQNSKLLEQQISDLNLNQNIKIFGVVQDSTLLDLLKSSKLFLFTDYEAGFSLAAAEAMAAGKPVVAYDLPIFGDTYKKGFIKVAKGNQQKMGQAIVYILKNTALRKKLGQEAINQAKMLDFGKTIQEFSKIINDSTQNT